LFAMLDLVCVQYEVDAERFAELGINPSNIHVTGSIKLDPSGGTAPQKREAFQAMLNDFNADGEMVRKVVLLASSHAGEESLVADALQTSASDALLVVVPRHAERRAEVLADLESSGFEVVLSSQYQAPENVAKACLLVDTTGELCDWTAHADVVVIGKSWLAEGGQNPAEAIIAGVPVITGPHMGNFEPLVSMLCDADGIIMLSSASELRKALQDVLADPEHASQVCQRAKNVLANHQKAVQKTIELLNMNASVSRANVQEYEQDHE